MVSVYDFRSYIGFLEDKGQLVRIRREVDPVYELSAVLWRLDEHGKAAVFEKIKGRSMPVVGGLYQTMDRIGVALGFAEGKQFGSSELLRLIHSAILKPTAYEPVKQGAVKDVVEEGTGVDLTKLPVPTFFEGDAGPYITAGVGITRNPETGVINMGVYRTQVIDRNKITVYGSPISDLHGIYRRAEEKGYESLDMAVAIGVDLPVLVAAISKTPTNISELEVAGSINGKPIKVVKCETVDLMVPANAEIVLEGKVDLKNKIPEGPFGEFTGCYGTSLNPVTNIKAVCHREDPLYHVIPPGRAREHFTLGSIVATAMNQIILKGLKSRFENIKEVYLPLELVGTTYPLIISIEKKSDEDPGKIIKAAFELSGGMISVSAFVKQIVVVDDDVDIHDSSDVQWAIYSRIPDESRIMVIPNMPSWCFDPVTKPDGTSVRIGIDATKPLKYADKSRRIKIPGLEKTRLEEYL